MKTTARAVRSTRRNCDDEACTIHKGNRKNGMHGAGELVIPVSGRTEAQVIRRWDDNGRREAAYNVWDGKTWTYDLPLPSRPRKAHAAAVQRARRFVRAGVLDR